MDKFKITFLPQNKTIAVDKGTSILSAAISLGLNINSSCGGDGVCGRCKIILKKGKIFSQGSGRLTSEEKQKGYLLACLSLAESDLEVEVPPESRLDAEVIIEGGSATDIDKPPSFLPEGIFALAPLSTKLFLKIPAPTLDDKVSDLERLYREIQQSLDTPILETTLANIRRLGELLREANWQVTVTLVRKDKAIEVALLEPTDTSQRNFGFAFDIGTTTISGQLIDLNTQEILGTKSAFNRQASFGSDVITRIIFARESEGLEQLHRAVADGMNAMIQELVREHNVDLNTVTACLCAGNTTMTHLLLQVDPTFIRREPYVATTNFFPAIHAAEAGIKINPHGILACSPGVASYLGGDITAGILSCGMARSSELSLLIDIGTNGEIVLGNKDWLIGCAASAGPAFEGSGVISGMRASKGAIQKVSVDKNLHINFSTIGNAKPQGICGSGYIDCLAEFMRLGIIDKAGKFNAADGGLVRQGEFGKELVVSPEEANGFAGDIVISEMDIDNLKRAKAAIYAAAAIMVRHMHLKWQDIKRIFIAGGFGTYLDMEKAVYIGLLPDLPREKFVFIGNSSLSGARQMLLSKEAWGLCAEVAAKTTYFELSTEPHYMDEYVAALFFPHTDLSRFPSVELDKRR
ncbi:MAG: ASKHA domain-containing protein [Candidatus Omnitrophota bacterium]